MFWVFILASILSWVAHATRKVHPPVSIVSAVVVTLLLGAMAFLLGAATLFAAGITGSFGGVALYFVLPAGIALVGMVYHGMLIGRTIADNYRKKID